MVDDAPRVEREGLAERVISGARWTTVSQVAMQALRLGTQVVLARLLAPEDFGAVAVALVVVHLLDIVMDLGTGNAIIQRPALRQPLASAIFVLNASLGLLLCLGLVLSAGVVADLFGTPDAEAVIQVMALAIIVTSLARTQQAMLRRRMRFRAVALQQIAGAFASAVVAIPAALLGAGVWALVAGHIAMVVVIAVMAYRASRWLPSRPADFRGLREIAGYSLNVSGFQLTEFLLQNADKVVIGRFLGVTQLGIYSVAERFMRYTVYALARVLTGVLFPAMSRVQNDPDSVRKGVLRSGASIAAVALPLMVGMSAVAPEFVLVILGERWLGTVPLIQVLAPAGAVQAIIVGVSTVFMAVGRADLQFRIGLATGVAYVVSFVVGVQWGLVGLAIAYAIAVAIMAVPGLVLPLRVADVRTRDFLRCIAPYVVTVTVMGGLVVAAMLTLAGAGVGPAVRLTVGVLLGAAVYTGTMLVLQPPAVHDVLTLVGMQDKLPARRGR